MIHRNAIWQWIAVILLSFCPNSARAQLPAAKLASLNQLGRMWGFGISDGYHECKECKSSIALPQLNAGLSGATYPVPCTSSEKPSVFSRMNPFKESTASKQPSHAGASGSGGHPVPMTVLPPSPQMYQQFAVPDATPLPGSSYPPSDPQLPFYAPEPAPNAYPSMPATPIPDPTEHDNFDIHSPSGDSTLLPDQGVVPPPPVLRKRQKGDNPLGEEPTPSLPRETVPADPLNKADDSLDLLPKDEPPPITMRSTPQHSRSLIRESSTMVDDRHFPQSPVSNTTMLQEYYGSAYFRQNVPHPMPRDLEAMRPTLNRYR